MAYNIFISWSGANSKEFAKALKSVLEEDIFPNAKLHCFVSDLDISFGTDWWTKIKSELKSCSMGIICITKENLSAPWIYFEAGSMVAHDVTTIPLLINCDVNSLSTTPLGTKHAIVFQDEKQFKRMIADINKAMGTTLPSGHVSYPLAEAHIRRTAKLAHTKLKNKTKKVLDTLTSTRFFNAKYVYPSDTTYICRDTIFICAPMSTITDGEYTNLRNSMLEIKTALTDIGFKTVHCPIINKVTPSEFDGKAKAIEDNFPLMKQSDCMLVIYPWRKASSALVEMGYGVALTKKMVVFHREGLPYIMDEAANSIPHIKTYSFKDFDDIKQIILSNGMALFKGVPDE